jgi:propanediol dehydratase large subunit
MTRRRRMEINAIRDVLDREAVLSAAAAAGRGMPPVFGPKPTGVAVAGQDTDEIVIGVSPAFGSRLFATLAGHQLGAVLKALREGIASRGLRTRLVRMWHTADTSFLGLSAARLAGSGIGIGIQAKGTAVIHQRGRLPHNNLELFSNAPLVSLAHYRAMGANAAAYALGELPEPIMVPTYGQALGSRYHAQVALIYAVETSMTAADALPEELELGDVAA